MQHFSFKTAVVLVLVSAAPLVHANSPTIRQIALSGEQAAGQATGIEYGDLFDTRLSIAPNGDVVFRNELVGAEVTITTNDALFRDFSAGGQQTVVRQGDAAPEFGSGAAVGSILSAATGSQIPSFSVSNASVLYGVNPNSPSLPAFVNGLVRQTNLTKQIIAQTLQPVPDGNPAETFGNGFFFNRLNAQGQAAFLTDTSLGLSLFRTNLNDQLETVFSTGDQAPDLPAGTGLNISSPFTARFDFANDGAVAMRIDLIGPGLNATNNEAIVISSGGGELELVARKGGQVPGLATGVLFQSIGEPSVNDNSRVAYRAQLNSFDLLEAIFLFDTETNETSEMVRVGDAIAGGSNKETLDDILDSPLALSMNNTAIFRGFVNDPALLRVSTEEGLELLGRRGDQAPGLNVGVTLNSSTILYESNNSGSVAFYSSLANLGPGATGLFANTMGEDSFLIAATGQTLDVNEDPLIDDFRVISEVGGFFELADNNELAFALRFEDGSSGLFRTTIVAPRSTRLPGDMDENGMVNIDDIASFVAVLLDPASATESQQCAADVNQDTDVNGLDLQAFLDMLIVP